MFFKFGAKVQLFFDICKFFLHFFFFFFIFLHFFAFLRIFYKFYNIKTEKRNKKNARVSQRRRAQNFRCYEIQIYQAAKVRNNFDISKFYAFILRYFCERKLRLVVLPVSACPYVLRAVHIYKRLGRYLVILV